MPLLDTRPQQYRPQKDIELNWNDFSGGWNNIFRPTELKANELADATNAMLTGKGVPTGRWGSDTYFSTGTGYIRGLGAYYKSTASQNDLLALSDSGFLTKRVGALATTVSGASFASGFPLQMVELGFNTYIVGGNKELTKYNGTLLLNYPTISAPVSLTATNISGASGADIWSWRVNALSQVGETLGSQAVQLSNLPADLTKTLIKLSWGAVSAASGVLRGYQVFRGTQGDETFIGSTDQNTTTFWDEGFQQSDTIFPPSADTTGGPKAKSILKFDDRLVVSGIDNDPSNVMVSGRYPYQDRFNWTYGGGYIRVAPDDGEVITALGVAGSNVRGGSVPASILVFKERSVYAVILKQVSIGNYSVLDPQFQKLAPIGTLSPDTVVQVENDTFFLDRSGLYSIGSEQNYLNEIRSREISSRIRTYMRGLTDDDFRTANAEYIDHKYILSFPLKKETIIYDYERRCFMGPWKTSFGITKWLKYFDTAGNEKWLAGCTDGKVREFSTALTTDSGSTIVKLLRTRKEDFGDWSRMKVIKLFKVLFRNVKGEVQVDLRLEDREGVTLTTKSFNITSSTGVGGWGTDQWGTQQYGLTANSVEITGEEVIRWAQLYKTARVLQIEVKTTTGQSNFEFLGVRASAQMMSEGLLNPNTRV